MKQFIFLLVILISIASCRSSNVIMGPVNYISHDTVGVKSYRFIVPGNKLKIGDTVSFTRTVSRARINSKIIHH